MRIGRKHNKFNTMMHTSSERLPGLYSLLGSSGPWYQFASQLVSSMSFFPPLSAYPCSNDLNHTTCAFPTPDVQSWRAVAVAVSSSALPIPSSSGYAAIALGLTAVMSVVAKYTVVPPKYHDFIP